MKEETALQEVEQPQLNQVQSDKASSLALITNDENMARVLAMAKLMAGSKVTVPKHLQGNEGDCAAVIIQAMNWGMNPFAVAQKTHLVGSTLGYEAQLVNAVVQESGAINGAFHYEFQGEGTSLACRVGAIIKGDSEVTWGEWLKSSSVTTKNSPLWKTNEKQQLGYLQVKNWARLYCPGAILGVYTQDELQQMPEKELNARPRTGAAVAEAAQGVTIDPAEEERRKGLITAFEAYAKKGDAVFTQAWQTNTTKQDRYLIGQQEYARLKQAALDADAYASHQEASQAENAVDGDFVADMDQAETK